MLQTQVNYWTLKENERSHLAQEAIQWAQTAESRRHNLAMEGFESANIIENKRHNISTENISSFANTIRSYELEETKWRNRKAVKQQQTSLKQENKRIAENRRHNKAIESIQKESNIIGFQNIGLGYSQLSENVRSNRASEQIRSYQSATERAQMEESKRHNVSTENQARFQNTVNYGSSQASQSQATTRREELSFEKDKFNITWPFERAESVSKTVQNASNVARNVNDIINSWIGGNKKKR